MNLFYIPTTDKNTILNYENTVIARKTYDGTKINNILPIEYSTTNIGLWGFKLGKHNDRYYNRIKNGDIVFFRTKDKEKYQCMDGFGYVYGKLKSKDISRKAWNNEQYENIILIGKFIEFISPFRLSKSKTKVASLDGVPPRIWHEGHNMFRQWKMKSDSNPIEDNFNEKDFIELLLEQVPHEKIYDIDEPAVNEYENDYIVSENDINSNIIKDTEKEQIIKIRIGQGKFKQELINKEAKCKICTLEDESFLIASHIKPWSKSSNQERLDVYNGFLLCPHHDALFDKGYITFDNDGKIIISDLLDKKTRVLLNIDENIKISLDRKHKKYLEWHRDNKFER